MESIDIRAGALVRGLLVLECFSPQEDSFTLSELAKRLDIPKSSLYRVVKTLSHMNYLRYEGRSKRYYLGMRVLSLGFSMLQSMELREIARPYMERLSRECNRTVNLAVFDKDEMVYVERIRVPGIRAFNIGVGNRIPVWNTAVGRAVLAHFDPEQVKEMLQRARRSPDFQLDEERMAKILFDVRKEGFAVSNQEFQRWVLAIAVPIFTASGVAGAINLVGEPEDVTVETLRNEYAPKLIQVGKELSESLGFREA